MIAANLCQKWKEWNSILDLFIAITGF